MACLDFQLESHDPPTLELLTNTPATLGEIIINGEICPKNLTISLPKRPILITVYWKPSYIRKQDRNRFLTYERVVRGANMARFPI